MRQFEVSIFDKVEVTRRVQLLIIKVVYGSAHERGDRSAALQTADSLPFSLLVVFRNECCQPLDYGTVPWSKERMFRFDFCVSSLAHDLS